MPVTVFNPPAPGSPEATAMMELWAQKQARHLAALIETHTDEELADMIRTAKRLHPERLMIDFEE